MYDYLLSAAESFIRYGISPTALIVAFIALFKTKKVKRIVSRRIPWLFRDEADVLNYQTRQIRIEQKIDSLLEERGIVWHGQSEISTSIVPSLETSFLLSPEEIPAERRTNMKKVVLDPGHGGKDPGAMGNGLVEKQYVLHVLLRVQNKLLADYANVEVVMTRNTDVFIELVDRSYLSNLENADLYVSGHLNAAGGSGGFETYRYPSSKNKEMQDIIHESIYSRLRKLGPVRDRGKKQGNFSVLRRTKAPAILVEYMFVDVLSDASMLKREEVISACVEGTVAGIAEYLQLIPKTSSNEITVTFRDDQSITGLLLDAHTWVPSRPTAEIMGGKVIFAARTVYIDNLPYDTRMINGIGYIRLRDLANQMGAKLEWNSVDRKTIVKLKGE